MPERVTKREGWYTDPLGQADLRWWDGRNWTEQVKATRNPARPGTATPAQPLRWAEADEFETLVDPNRIADHQPPIPPARPTVEPQPALFASSAGTAAPATESPESTAPDWSDLAFSLRTAGDDIVSARAAGLPDLTVDMAHRIYWWAYELDSFPSHPVDLRTVETPRKEAILPSVAGRDIEPLLWRVGTGSSSGSALMWADPTSRYKLRRWPNLTAMPHTPEQERMTTMLANAALTPVELAAVAQASERDVKILIGTYALMSLLEVTEDPAAKPRQQQFPPPPVSRPAV